MKILQISSAKNFGGGERHFIDLCEGLSKRNHEVFVALRKENTWQDTLQKLTKNKALEARRLTAAGRGEFNPIAGNDTKAGKAKNRRIEIIIQPDLSIFGELLSE